MKAINDALCLRGLEDQSTINIPIQAPSTWKKDLWADQIDLDVGHLYNLFSGVHILIRTA